jgi:hypothetical protein
MNRFAGKPRRLRETRRQTSIKPCLEALPDRILLDTNPIVTENLLPGSPVSEWAIYSFPGTAGDPSIQGFATDISLNHGQTVSFKINDTAAAPYHLDIYRMGYYQGNGARRVATIDSSHTLPIVQPNPLTDPTTGLVDCGNWSVTATWAVPATAVSGIYFAHVVRDDTGGDSQIFFIVRDDNDPNPSDMLFQTSDTTWEAYNDYGGNSLYIGSAPSSDGRAYKVSYNRPFDTRSVHPESWVFANEYPMVRYLEANGYWVSYTTGVDTDRNGAQILQHKAFLSVGHDEYWSGQQRTNVEAARDQGVNLAFFSGNEVYWKTRWENSIDPSNTPYRTLVCYKESQDSAKLDPTPTWTGTWRDPRFSPPADGGRPENGLTGTIYGAAGGINASITVPEADGKMRFWRNTDIATLPPGTSATLPVGTLGFEIDEPRDNGLQPAGVFKLSTTPYEASRDYLLDYGSRYGAGTVNHSLTLYRAASGALVFGAGTVQWSWGLDNNHDGGGSPPDVRMQQATVNLFADMGVQPGSLQPGLTPATASTDHTPPTSVITSPAPGAIVQTGSPVTITGTASDSGGGVVGGVEVSVDGGATWHPATGRASWSYTWWPNAPGVITIRSRAVDDSGNLESPSAGRNVQVIASPNGYSIWTNAATPIISPPYNEPQELGLKFYSDVAGTITGVRFYKAADSTGIHVGNLYDSSGNLLATVTFSNETASGWQQALFSSPVAISPNTIYVASYTETTGSIAENLDYFIQHGVDNGALHAPSDAAAGGNGVYHFGSGFPDTSYRSSNYWVDVLFNPTGMGGYGKTGKGGHQWTFAHPVGASGPSTGRVPFEGGPTMLGTEALSAVSRFLTAASFAGNTSAPASVSGNAPLGIETNTPTPAIIGDNWAVELGPKVRSDVAAAVAGMRFSKAADSTATPIGYLWDSIGNPLATAIIDSETGSG